MRSLALTWRMRIGRSGTKPLPDAAIQFVGAPVAGQHAVELERVGAAADRAAEVRARGGETGVARQLDGLGRVIAPAAERVGEGRHGPADGSFQGGLAVADL